MWWAFITSGTLGYGDKCPRSIRGRLFGITWILVGIVSIAMLAGLLTSSLNASNAPASTALYGKEVKNYRIASNKRPRRGRLFEGDVYKII